MSVLVPRAPASPHWRRLAFAPVPLLAIGGLVVVLDGVGRAVDRIVTLSVVATPAAALAGVVIGHRVRLVALAVPLAWVVAWRAPHGRFGELAAAAVIVLACATFAWLTGLLAPRAGLAVAIVATAAVDVYQVLVTEQIQRVATALATAPAPAGLPKLVDVQFAGASMGYGDVYLAALLGVVVGTSRRASAAAAALVFCGLLIEGFAFRVIDTIPATVPVAVALLLVLLRRRASRDTLFP